MKIKIIINILILLALIVSNDWGQVTTTSIISKGNNKPDFLVKQYTVSNWNTKNGIPYVQRDGVSLGATSFQLLGDKKVAFLCNSSNEIIIKDIADNTIIKKIPVLFAPKDFIYDNGLYYVLGESQIIVYDEQGNEIKKYLFPNRYAGTDRLIRYDNATYLLLPSGNSLQIEKAGVAINPQEYEGWITSNGDFVKTKITGNYSYSVKVIKDNREIFNKVYSVNKKVAGVFVVGSTKNHIVLDVQTFTSENPIEVERMIVLIDLQKNNLGSIMSSIVIPDIYYVISNKDFYVSPNGNILNMITTPRGVYVFTLKEDTLLNVNKGYPESLKSLKYHFNDHLK